MGRQAVTVFDSLIKQGEALPEGIPALSCAVFHEVRKRFPEIGQNELRRGSREWRVPVEIKLNNYTLRLMDNVKNEGLFLFINGGGARHEIALYSTKDDRVTAAVEPEIDALVAETSKKLAELRKDPRFNKAAENAYLKTVADQFTSQRDLGGRDRWVIKTTNAAKLNRDLIFLRLAIE